MERADNLLGFTDAEVEVLRAALRPRVREDETAEIVLGAIEITFKNTWNRVKGQLEEKYGRAVYDAEIMSAISEGDDHKMYMTWDDDLVRALREALEQLAFYDLDHDTEEIDEQTTRLSREMLFELIEVSSNAGPSED